MKLNEAIKRAYIGDQPPSGGCVLKLSPDKPVFTLFTSQPPSGGCVLKREYQPTPKVRPNPAAFGRLCVETGIP